MRGDRIAGFATYAPEGLRFSWLRDFGRAPGVGIFGPIGVEPAFRHDGLGAALATAALCGLRAQGYTQAIVPAVGDQSLVEFYAASIGARVVERFTLEHQGPKIKTVVMASGNGSNFQAVIDRVQSGVLPLDIRALVSNNPNAYAIQRARAARIPAHTLVWDRANARGQFDEELLRTVADAEPELVLLLGWMHLLDDAFLEAFPEMLNIHPAYLPLDPNAENVTVPDGTRIPAFRGAHAVRDAIAATSPWIGASVHRVTSETDRGEILVRKPLRVADGSGEEDLMARLHAVEHDLVTRGIKRWLYER
jgi:phosphoribosylglycinamide formyltransferase-1